MKLGLLLLLGLVACAVAKTDNPYCQAKWEQDPKLVDQMKNFGKLEMVHVLIRHGDRAPCQKLEIPSKVSWNCKANSLSYIGNISSSANEVDRVYRKRYIPSLEVLPGNCGLGELTERGREQHISLGTYWRKLYINTYGFLPKKFDSTKMFIRSTDVFRTVQSAQANLLGLYPKAEHAVIDIYTVDRSTDYMTPNSRQCPKLSHLLNNLYSDSMWKRHFKKVVPLMDRLHEVLGIPEGHHLSIGAVFDHLNARQCHAREWPTGFNEEDLEAVNRETIWHTKTTLSTKELNRLSIGRLLNEWFTHMKEKVEGKRHPKWYLYSGHDSSVFPFLTALGIWDGLWPPYASQVMIELWSQPCDQDSCDGEEKNYFVRVIYNGKAAKVPGCKTTICPFVDFKDAIEDVLLTHPSRQCALVARSHSFDKRSFPTMVNSYQSFINDFFTQGADFS